MWQKFGLRFFKLPFLGLRKDLKVTLANFTFVEPCIVNVFEQNQQDATLHKGSGRSSAHHQELKTVNTASGICRAFSAIVSELKLTHVSTNSLTIAVRSRKSPTNTRCCVYSFELLMMGGGTA